jgi:hypothetical protein
MNKKSTKLIFLPFWVIISAFMIAACTTDEMDSLQVEKSLSKEPIESGGDFDLKKGNSCSILGV